ncbi:MAG TPA: MBOAT family O-acyltransferase [Beijerinckiaceae bacterium]|jgi:alginate O-acetyltransferase complex protein AlgI|nr:MBOAT family O-acyltransferase [Beijerinckiaceae bacterium]
MLFYEPLFLFLFFPILLVIYFFLGHTRPARKWILVLGSFVFYAWSEPIFVWIVLASSLADQWIGLYIGASKADRKRKYALALGVVLNIGILCYYKYTLFLITNVDSLLQALHKPQLAIPAIALPIGVSFVVFEKITYLVDVYRGLTSPARNFSQYLTYVLFFPKLLAGPIIKYHDIVGQFEQFPESHVDDFFIGLSRFMLGLIKKTLLADTLATGADLVFAQDPAHLTSSDAWWGVLFFTLQIYFDFSGYSDMAIGIARMLGFRLLENFNKPYIATSMTDFWRRWHISLTSWIREYLYFPLGGNRAGAARTYLNLWICFLASGMWHGAAWNFVLWGAYSGLFLILDRLFLLSWLNRMPVWLANFVTVLVVMVGWVLFRSTSLHQALQIFELMLNLASAPLGAVTITNDVKSMAGVGVLICVMQRVFAHRPDFQRIFEGPRSQIALQSALTVLFVIGIGKSVAAPFKPFLYFRF